MSAIEKETLEFLKEIKELNEHAILSARQSVPESLSPILSEIRNKTENNGIALKEHIEIHEQDIRAIKEQIEALSISVKPAVSVVNVVGGMQKGIVWTAALFVAIAIIVGPFLAYKEWLKK